MLKRAALVVVVLFASGCGPAEEANDAALPEAQLAYHRVAGKTGIWVANADGSEPRLLVPEEPNDQFHSLQISPDGAKVAYLGDCGVARCPRAYVVSTIGDKPPRLAEGLEEVRWAPDSRHVVGIDWPINVLTSIDVETGEEVKLAQGEIWEWSFSPDGRQIVFARAHGANPDKFEGKEIDLFVVEADGGEAKQITDTGDAAYPVWGPKAIAFSKLIAHNRWGRHEISRIDPDGTDREDITGPLPKQFLMRGCVGLIPVDWSDDGRALLAGWLCEFGNEPVAVDPETGDIRSFDQGSEAVALSADGTSALVQESFGAETPPEEEKVLVVPYGGGKPTVVVQGATDPTWTR
jgi:dipeptidyl aminopeptidase/acylaminoacyl peptidase